MKKYDLIVIGGGAGGLVAAAGAASFGAKTALIHEGRLGGDCLWTGCVPTKSLLHIAQTVHRAKQAAAYGFSSVHPPSFQLVREQILQSMKTIEKHDDPERFRQMGIEVVQGTAQFDEPHIVKVGGERLYGKRIIIATGSETAVPGIPGLAETGFVSNERFLQMADLPERWLMIGGGPIGLEFGQAFQRLGSSVTIAEQAKEILPREDAEMAGILKSRLMAEGLEFLTDARIIQISKDQRGKRVEFQKDGSIHILYVDEILAAAGRKARTADLQLEAAGVRTVDGHIPVNSSMQTNVPHIYAVGDVNGRMAFTHVAAWEAKAAVSHALFGMKRKWDENKAPWVIFTDPELFHLGMTEWEARQIYSKIRIYKTELGSVDRFITDQESFGMIKIIAKENGEILGAHAVGRGAGDFMQEVAFAKHYGHRIGDISHVLHPYPTYSGAVQTTADLYWREKLFTGKLGKWLQRYARWFRGRS